MKHYACACGAVLGIEDGKMCDRCFVMQHAAKPRPDLINADQLRAWLVDPTVEEFFDAVKKEIVFQRASWGHLDNSKDAPAWFWLLGRLLTKALVSDSLGKRRHHLVTAAACLFLWLEGSDKI